MRIARLSLAVAALLALAAPPAAFAKLPGTADPYLTPGVGIGGVDLGDRQANAKAAWGRGGDCTDFNCTYNDPRRPQLGYAQFDYEDGPRGKISLVQISVGTGSNGKPSFRTPLASFESPRGIHLGSSFRAVKAAYPRARTFEGTGNAFLSLSGARRSQTLFSFVGGRLTRVLIQDDRPRG